MRSAEFPLIVVGGRRGDTRHHDPVRLPLVVSLPLVGMLSGGLWWCIWRAVSALF